MQGRVLQVPMCALYTAGRSQTMLRVLWPMTRCNLGRLHADAAECASELSGSLCPAQLTGQR